MYKSVLLLCCAMLAGCGSLQMRSPTAKATLTPTKGNQAAGTVTFVQRGDKVTVEARITGLSPGDHGFHVHEKGDCRAADASSAGGHFNPAGAPHAHPGAPAHHAGDLGNLVADANGVAFYRAQVHGISLGTESNSIIGLAVIVHEKADDLLSQPAGDAGQRLACGLVSKTADRWF